MPLIKDSIRSLRKELDLTQKEMAKILGVSHPFISMFERGLRSPSYKTLCKLIRLAARNGIQVDEHYIGIKDSYKK